MEDPEAASQRLRSLEQWLGKLRQFTAESWATKAWNLDPNEPMQPLGIEVRDLLPREKTCGPRPCWEDMRVPVGAIDFRFVDRCESPTHLEEIDLQLPEEKPWTLGRGTKTALKYGGNRYLQAAARHEEDPHFFLPTIGMTGTAISDPWGQLEYGQCYLVSNGRLLLGKFAVWRDPVMSAQDVQATRHGPA